MAHICGHSSSAGRSSPLLFFPFDSPIMLRWLAVSQSEAFPTSVAGSQQLTALEVHILLEPPTKVRIYHDPITFYFSLSLDPLLEAHCSGPLNFVSPSPYNLRVVVLGYSSRPLGCSIHFIIGFLWTTIQVAQAYSPGLLSKKPKPKYFRILSMYS